MHDSRIFSSFSAAQLCREGSLRSVEEFMASAPTNFLPHYGIINAVKFTYRTEKNRTVQCVKLLLPGGVAIDDVVYEVSECGKSLSVFVDAPPLLHDTKAIDRAFGSEADGHPDFTRLMSAHKDLFMEMKNKDDRPLVSSAKIPLDFEVVKTIVEDDVLSFGDKSGAIVVLINLYKVEHEQSTSKPKRFKMVE